MYSLSFGSEFSEFNAHITWRFVIVDYVLVDTVRFIKVSANNVFSSHFYIKCYMDIYLIEHWVYFAISELD